MIGQGHHFVDAWRVWPLQVHDYRNAHLPRAPRSVNGCIGTELVSNHHARIGHLLRADLAGRYGHGAADIVKDIPGTGFFVQNNDAVNRPCPRGALDEPAIHSGSFQCLPGSPGEFILSEHGPVSAMGAQAAGSGEGRCYLAPHIAAFTINPDFLIWRRVRIYVQAIVYGNGSKAKNVKLRSGHFSLRVPRVAWLFPGSPGRE